jgi:hypothetical protein
MYKNVFLSLCPPLPEAGELPQEFSLDNEAPEADKSWDGEEFEGS